MTAAVTRYEGRRICPRCPARQVIRVSFVTAEPWSIDYECSNCGERWHDDLQSVNNGYARPAAVPHARGFNFPGQTGPGR
jgi:transposase-like protein